tara:strand:- start:35 stop:754 length:720 start_codon:yes stop_codon:yes gene_type:complete
MRRIGDAVDSFARQEGLELSEAERGDVVQALAERGGSVSDAFDAMEMAELRATAEEIDDGASTGRGSSPRDVTPDAGEPRGGDTATGVRQVDAGLPRAGEADQGPDRAARSERTDAGDQLLVDGIDPISDRNRLESQMQAAMRGGDQAADFGLFDLTARDQMDMFSEGGATKDVDAMNTAAARDLREAIEESGDFDAVIQMEDGSTRKMSASQWLDELDAEEDFAQIAEICAPNRGATT